MTELYRVVSGSTSYGLETPKSDIDYQSIYLNTLIDELRFNTNKEKKNVQHIDNGQDILSTHFNSYLRQLQQGSFTFLETLFCREEFILHKDTSFDLILQNRQGLLTQQCVSSIKGHCHRILKDFVQKEGYEYKGKKLSHAFRLLSYLDQLKETGAFCTYVSDKDLRSFLLQLKEDKPLDMSLHVKNLKSRLIQLDTISFDLPPDCVNLVKELDIQVKTNFYNL